MLCLRKEQGASLFAGPGPEVSVCPFLQTSFVRLRKRYLKIFAITLIKCSMSTGFSRTASTRDSYNLALSMHSCPHAVSRRNGGLWNLLFLTQVHYPAAYFPPVHSRHGEVTQHEVNVMGLKCFQRIFP